jgi:hypothetical protein
MSLAMIASVTSATPYWTESDYQAHQETSGPPEVTFGPPTVPLGISDYQTEFGLISAFLAVWQVSVPGPDFGGIREGEHLPDIIQTDNTSATTLPKRSGSGADTAS